MYCKPHPTARPPNAADLFSADDADNYVENASTMQPTPAHRNAKAT